MGLAESLAKALGIKQDNDESLEDKLAVQLAELLKPTTDPPTPPTNPPPPTGPPDVPSVESLAKALAELRVQGKGKELEEIQKTVKALTEDRDKLHATLRLTESTSQVQRLSEGPGWVLPIPAQERLLHVLVTAPDDVRKEVVALFEGIHNTGLVELKERGATPQDLDLTRYADDPVAQFGAKVEALQRERKLTESAAMRAVAGAEPRLYDAYRRAVDLNRVGVS